MASVGCTPGGATLTLLCGNGGPGGASRTTCAGAPSRRILSAEGWRLVPLRNCWGERVGTGADDGGPWKHPWNGHERKKQEWQLGGGGAELLWWSSDDDVTFQSRGAGVIPGQRAKILHASWPKKQNIKQKQCSNKFNKDFKNVP